MYLCVALWRGGGMSQDERGELMQQMQELQAQVEAQSTELQQYADNDPEALAKLTEATEVREGVGVAGGWLRMR